jgi:hypothetical protein
MARPDELVVGNCYFTVKFHDRDLLFPYVSTLKFLGCESDEAGKRLWLFDDPTDMPDSEEAQSQDAEAVLGLEDEHLYQVLDFHGLQRELAAVAVDHPLSPIPKPEGPAATLPPELNDGVRKFLSEPQHSWVTVTILFTDDGLSIGRREDGIELSFFAHPRRDPQEEEKIRALFGELGIPPHEGYLADRGRTRVLGFAAPEGLDELTALCGRILREVYAIRGGDTLKFDFHPRS